MRGMHSRYEFLFRLLFRRETKYRSEQGFQILGIPYLDIMVLNKQYKDIDFEFKKVKTQLGKIHPAEIITDNFTTTQDQVICDVLTTNYINYLRNIISQLYYIRYDEEMTYKIIAKSSYFHCDKINLITDKNCEIIWTTYAINIYGRPYNTNKYWEAIPQFKFSKEIVFDGEVRKVNLEKQPFKKNLFDEETFGSLFNDN